MTTEEKQRLHLFETRVRQLILKYKELEDENRELHAMVDERDKYIEKLKQEYSDKEQQYKNLKMARMIDVTSQESEDAQKRIGKLIREIDKCIALINL